MREIKFRAYLPEYESMIDENFEGNNTLSFEDVSWDCTMRSIGVYVLGIFDIEVGGEHVQDYKFDRQENAQIMQFTGLTDKNGVEIYEGDIVKSYFYGEECNDIAKIKYDDSSAAFVYDSSEQDAFVFGAENGQLEVIGNIYENPELLEQQ